MSTTTDDLGSFTPHPGPARSMADTIADADDVESIEFPVSEWGITLELRSPNAEERGDMIAAFIDMETGENRARDLKILYPALLCACCYDPATGERVWNPGPQSNAAILRKRGAIVERVAKACMPLVGLRAEDTDAEKDGSSTSPN